MSTLGELGEFAVAASTANIERGPRRSQSAPAMMLAGSSATPTTA
jgi:hypothetical protein